MADEPKTPEYPPQGFPTVFADVVTNIVNSPSLVKFFLARFEPDLNSLGPTKSQPFAQVIMPMDGFVSAFAFFEAAINRYLAQGTIKQETIDQYREANKTIEWKTAP